MAASKLSPFFFLVLFIVLSTNRVVQCDDDEEDTLFKGINDYRDSLKLTTLTKNDNAECLADELADQFKKQPCTNTTGSATVPGTEPQFGNYPDLLNKCHLNVTVTRDGAVMPACIPDLVPSLVLTNFTKSQYSGNLNDSKFTGVGIGSEGNWIVVVLTTSTPEGGYETATKSASVVCKTGFFGHLILLLIGCLFML